MTGLRRPCAAPASVLLVLSLFVQLGASDRDLLFDTEGKLIGIWTPSGAVPSNRVQEGGFAVPLHHPSTLALFPWVAPL